MPARVAVVRALACLLLTAMVQVAWAAQHALLVGVSAYPALGKDKQLQGPANDVRLMRDALIQRGFAASQIQVLADGADHSAGLPTREAILTALDRLARTARAGDTVVIHFSGHGSQQPAPPDANASRRESDGLQEIFLPRDVGRTNDRFVINAITDTTLREVIDRISDTGAFVWAIFDTCHSGTLVRGGGDGAKTRQVAPADLGLNIAAPQPGTRPSVRSSPPPRPATALRGRAAYFYAAQSGEATSELLLPKGKKDALPHGIFSYTLASAIASGQPMSYRQLGDFALAQYGRMLEAHWTPLFTGDGLDEPVFGQRSPSHRQWLLDKRNGSLSVAAGSLDGLAVGAMFALLPDPSTTSAIAADTPLGFLRATAVEPGRSALQAVGWQGRPPPAPAALVTGSLVRLLASPPSFTFRVATDLGTCAPRCAASAALAQLRRDGVAGVDIRWVVQPDAHDVLLHAGPATLRYRLPGERDGPPGASTQALGWALPRDADTAALAQRIAADLHALARARNLLQLAAQLALRGGASALDVSLHLRPAGQSGTDRLLGAGQTPTLKDGDGLVLRIRNRSATAVDLTVLFLDANHGIATRFPADHGESNRLESGATREIGDMTVNTRTAGTERLMLVWTEMRRHRERRDFSFLQQSPLARARTDTDPDLQALMDACFADQLTRSDGVPAIPPDSLGMQVYTFHVSP